MENVNQKMDAVSIFQKSRKNHLIVKLPGEAWPRRYYDHATDGPAKWLLKKSSHNTIAWPESAPIEKAAIPAPTIAPTPTPTIATPEPEKAIEQPQEAEKVPEIAVPPVTIPFKIMDKPQNWKVAIFDAVEIAIAQGATTDEMNRALCYAIYSQKDYNNNQKQKEAQG